MKVGILGAGRIGGNTARQALRAGHEVVLAFSREPDTLRALAADLGDHASVGTAAEAVASADVTVLSVPWAVIGLALEQAGPLDGSIVIDTTNHYRSDPAPSAGQTAAAFNAARMPGALYTKSFNTLTSAFQAEAAGRTGADRIVQWICGDDQQAKTIVAGLIESMGYAPVDLGGTADCAVMESPRRDGAVYGEEYRLPDALAVVDAVRAGRPIPPIPTYT
jgi:8-hydroxy-5-deazaflavin:NADPH oxidoreductase